MKIEELSDFEKRTANDRMKNAFSTRVGARDRNGEQHNQNYQHLNRQYQQNSQNFQQNSNYQGNASTSRGKSKKSRSVFQRRRQRRIPWKC
jgi:hypothetical protein